MDLVPAVAASETVGLVVPAGGAAITGGAGVVLLLIGFSAALLSTGSSDVGFGA